MALQVESAAHATGVDTEVTVAVQSPVPVAVLHVLQYPKLHGCVVVVMFVFLQVPDVEPWGILQPSPDRPLLHCESSVHAFGLVVVMVGESGHWASVVHTFAE
jgi:hypothetical protein